MTPARGFPSILLRPERSRLFTRLITVDRFQGTDSEPPTLHSRSIRRIIASALGLARLDHPDPFPRIRPIRVPFGHRPSAIGHRAGASRGTPQVFVRSGRLLHPWFQTASTAIQQPGQKALAVVVIATSGEDGHNGLSRRECRARIGDVAEQGGVEAGAIDLRSFSRGPVALSIGKEDRLAGHPPRA